MSGNDLIIYEEKYCSRLQEEFLKKKCFDDREVSLLTDKQIEDFVNSDEYFDFVQDDMDSRGNE